MLSDDDTRLLTRVGPGTPMGALMRQYWLPALLSTELAEPDGRPLRLRLLCEDLIAFRDSAGKAGLLADTCAHRGASLFFGRNEAGGLRCVYHGWKFDVSGHCLDMPNEPAESNFRDKVRQRAYPCRERNGVVWAYMGPREAPPPLPDLEWNMTAQNAPLLWKSYRACNWLQAVEGDLDVSHLDFLHNVLQHARGPDARVWHLPGSGPVQIAIANTEAGVSYLERRNSVDGCEIYRAQPFCFPFHTMIGTGRIDGRPLTVSNGKAWVPMDDEHTLAIDWLFRPATDWLAGEGNPWSERERAELLQVRMPFGFLPATSEPAGAWKPRASRANDYLLDEELQRTRAFSGILGNPTQDAAMQESMGPIANRSREHLGSADAMSIRVQRRLLEAVRALQEEGVTPPGVDHPEHYRARFATGAAETPARRRPLGRLLAAVGRRAKI